MFTMDSIHGLPREIRGGGEGSHRQHMVSLSQQTVTSELMAYVLKHYDEIHLFSSFSKYFTLRSKYQEHVSHTMLKCVLCFFICILH